MQKFETKCPHCNAELDAQEDWVGMEVECPVCKKNFTISAQTPAPPPVLTPVTKNVQPAGKFTFVCPSCNGEVELENHLRGTQYECQFCFDEHIAEPTVTSTPGLMQINAEETFIFICPECDTVAELPEVLKNKEYECQCCCETSIAREAIERNCPSCGEKIKIKATVCKHCKQSVPPIIPAQTGDRKFCKQNLTENIITFVPNHKNNGTSVWEKLTSLPPYVRRIGVGIIILLFLAICSGIFFVWNDNYLIKAWKIEKRVQAYSSWSRECSGESFSLSPVNVTLDNMGSFFAGFFFCYGEDTFRNKNRLLDKVLYRYGKEGKNNREAIMTTMEIWYAAKKQQAENEGRYLDY